MGTEAQENGKERLLNATRDGSIADDSGPGCKKILLLGSLALVRFLENTCGALPTPFFARVMQEKGGTTFDASISLQIRMLSFVLFSPVLGRYSVKIGAKRLRWLAILASALMQALFGALAFVNDHMWFFVGTMLARLLYGVGKAALYLAVSIVAFREYPNRVSLVYGVLQGAGGFGLLAGPPAGGILYDKMGMAIPVIGSAVVLLLVGLLPCCLMDAGTHVHENTHTEFSLRSFLLKPMVIATILVICSETGIIGYLEVSLTLYFQQQSRSASLTGAALMIAASAFAFSAPLIGFLVGKYSYVRRFSVGFGIIVESGVLFAFTPNQSLGVIYAVCLLIGAFAGLTHISSVEVLTVAANEGSLNSEQSNPALYGNVLGISQCAFGVGMLLFPTVASLIQTETSFSFTEIISGVAAFNIIIAIVHLCVTLIVPKG